MTPLIRSLRRTAVILDNFLDNPDEVRAFGLAQKFHEDRRYFRGQRSITAHPWECVKNAVERLLGLRVKNWDKHPTNGVFQFCVGGDQLVYHSDLNSYAAVLYLTPDAPPSAGTTLYRSKATRGRTVEESRVIMRDAEGFDYTEAQVEKEMYAGKLLDRTAWEVVDVFGNVYNRLVVWDAKLVHAASDYFGTCKEDGRLFQMYFWDAE